MSVKKEKEFKEKKPEDTTKEGDSCKVVKKKKKGRLEDYIIFMSVGALVFILILNYILKFQISNLASALLGASFGAIYNFLRF